MNAELRQIMAGPSSLPPAPSPSGLPTPSSRRSSVITTASTDSDYSDSDSLDCATVVGSVDEEEKEEERKPASQSPNPSQSSSLWPDFDLADCWKRLFGGMSM